MKGAKNKRHVLDGKEDKIIALLNAGVAKTKIAKDLKISNGTLYDFIKKQASE